MSTRPPRRSVTVGVSLVALLASALLPAPAESQAPQTPGIYAFGFVGFNTRSQPFANPEARRAVLAAVDRNRVARGESDVATATGIIPPGCIGYNRAAQMPGPDVQRAGEILARAGIRAADLGEVVLWLGPERSAARGGQALAESLRALGLRVTVNNERANLDALRRLITAPALHLFYLTMLTDACRRGSLLEHVVHSKGMANLGGYASADLDGLIDRARASDGPARERMYAEAEQRALDDAVIVPLWWGNLPERIYRPTTQASLQNITVRVTEVSLTSFETKISVTIENGTDAEAILTQMRLDARVADEWGNAGLIEFSRSTLPERVPPKGSATGVLTFRLGDAQSTRKLTLSLPRMQVGDQEVTVQLDISPP